MRTAKQQADDFIKANAEHPVISGGVLEPNPDKPAKGGWYRLSNGAKHRLSVEACRLLPAGYPRWKL